VTRKNAECSKAIMKLRNSDSEAAGIVQEVILCLKT
jgi:hypothetical protein